MQFLYLQTHAIWEHYVYNIEVFRVRLLALHVTRESSWVILDMTSRGKPRRYERQTQMNRHTYGNLHRNGEL